MEAFKVKVDNVYFVAEETGVGNCCLEYFDGSHFLSRFVRKETVLFTVQG